MRSFFLIFLFLGCFPFLSSGQEPDSLSAEATEDSLPVFQPTYPNPKKAAFLSLAIPGAGQIYNKRWWKLPLVYGAMGALVYTIDFNQSRFRRFRTAYDKELKGEEHEFTGTNIGNSRSLRLLRDSYDKRTQVSYIGFVAVYALSALDAFVDAHLKSFDINDDLSMHIHPEFSVPPLTSQPAIGIGVRLNLYSLSDPQKITTKE